VPAAQRGREHRDGDHDQREHPVGAGAAGDLHGGEAEPQASGAHGRAAAAVATRPSRRASSSAAASATRAGAASARPLDGPPARAW